MRLSLVRYLFVVGVLLLLGAGAAGAATMTAVSRFPANGAVEVPVDTKLWVTWGSIQTYAATSGNLKICRASDNAVVYQLNLQSLPSGTYGPIAAGWPYQISLAGKTVNYQPFVITTNLLEVHPAVSLAYNTTYYIKMTQGFCYDGSGRPSPAIDDSVTWRFTTKAVAPANDGEYVVTADGSGDFCTVQGAVNAVPDYSSSRTVIKVRSGTYREIVNVPVSKQKITVIGEDRDTTNIAAYNNNNFNTNGSGYRCMIQVNADDFRIYNITFRNTTPQGGSQAETFYFNGVYRCLASNCRFYSYQDTLLITGTMYFADCYIEGDVDYMWGYGSTFFDRCQLNSVRTGGYNLMPRNGSGVPGYIFRNCTLTAPAGVSGVYLARDAGLKDGVPYFPYGQVVYIECKMGTHIASVGWKITDGYDPAQLFLAEYHSMDLAGNLLNVSGRDYRSRQLNATDAAYWGTVTNVLGGWDPASIVDLPMPAWQPQPASSAVTDHTVTLKWAAGVGATSHQIYLDTVNPPAVLYATTTVPTVSVGAMSLGKYYWRVVEQNAYGTTSGPVWTFTTVADGLPPSPDPMAWAVAPAATGQTTAQMTATTATDTSGVEYYFFNYTDPNHDSGWQSSTFYADSGLTPATAYAYGIIARDKSPLGNTTAVSAPRTVTTASPPDTFAPTPDPMTWAVPPYAIDYATIAMTATVAGDASPVEYYFACVSGGGHDSGWQDSNIYYDGGLAEGVIYTYTVQARDKSPAQNAGTASAPASASVLGAAPLPDPMTFAVAPHATGIDSIAMSATIASDPSGVEYYFANTALAGHDSGWRDDPNWTDIGLVNNTTYDYRVIARDKTSEHNETAWSEVSSATTPRYDCTPGMAADVDDNCMVDFADYAALATAWSQTPPTVERAVNGSFDTDIVPGWRQLDLPSATGSFFAWYDNTAGDPIGAAGIASDNTSETTSGHYLYQAIPVTAGMQYTFSAEWTGDMSMAGVDPANRTLWSRVLVFFEGSADPNYWTSLGSPDSIAYGKSFGATSQNVGASGAWDWEQVTASPVHGPAEGLFTATAGYMVIALDSGGLTGSDVGFYYIDNVSVTGQACPQHDLNDDCRLDFGDIALYAQQWLMCSRNPQAECWIR